MEPYQAVWIHPLGQDQVKVAGSLEETASAEVLGLAASHYEAWFMIKNHGPDFEQSKTTKYNLHLQSRHNIISDLRALSGFEQ